jgi:hypothetical protein
MRSDDIEGVMQLDLNRKDPIMKRFIAAVSFAVLAVPAAAFAADAGAPYEQNQIDRALPDVTNPVVESASAGPTNAPAGIWASGVWADDSSFIAPAK